jgi:hypothetical protein
VKRVFTAAIVLCFVSLASLASAQDARLTADTYVSSTAPAANYGSAPFMSVSSTNSALVAFDLSTFSTSTTIGKAYLRLYVNSAPTPGILSFALATQSWAPNENTVTYNTRPAIGSVFTTATASAGASFVLVDVTTQVQGWIATPGSNNGIEITASGSTSVNLDTKESPYTSHVAGLSITAAGAGGSTGATGATGPTGAAATIAVLNTLTGAPGSLAAVGASGTTGAVALTFTVPQGPTGPSGPSGAAGPTGAGTVGAAGPTGATGAAGTAATIGVGTVNTGVAGSSATVTNAGTSSAAIFNFSIPKGATGATGATGAAGATGSNGSQGPTGAAGAQGATGAVSASSFIVSIMNQNGNDAGNGVFASPFGTNSAATSIAFTNGSEGVAPASCTASNLNVGVYVPTTNGTALGITTTTLFVGSGTTTPTATTLACSSGTIAGSAGSSGSCTDHTHTVSITAGNTLSLKFFEVNGATASGAYFSVSFVCQ